MLFLPRDKTFFDLFDRAAENMVHTAEMFLEMLRNMEIREQFADKIREAEHTGDAITHEAITKLNKTFFTALDREDIHALIAQSDDVVDYLDSAAQRFNLYGIEHPSEDLIKQAEVAVQITRSLAAAIGELRNIKKQDKLCLLLIEINDWENRGDEHNHAALARLFETNDPMYVLKWKELYEIVEDAIDACERVAHTIRNIMVKHS
jgi:predicted phosphate transport protein (TIGR00153 family)